MSRIVAAILTAVVALTLASVPTSAVNAAPVHTLKKGPGDGLCC